MPVDLGREMALPFEQIIGGPLQAVIRASVMADSATADFIENIGLQTDSATATKSARTVAFSFNRTKPNPDGSGTTTELVNLNVPLLTILPVPYIRLAKTTLDFEAKVSSQTVETSQSKFNIAASASGNYGAGFWGVRASLNTSFERQTASSDTMNRAATLTVHVEAVQDEVPGGLARMLGILETAIADASGHAPDTGPGAGPGTGPGTGPT